MRQHQVRRLAHHVKNALFQDVEARMQIEATSTDVPLPTIGSVKMSPIKGPSDMFARVIILKDGRIKRDLPAGFQ
jgi:hypothetical protein